MARCLDSEGPSMLRQCITPWRERSDVRGSSRQPLCGKSSPPPRARTEAFHSDAQRFLSTYLHSIAQSRRDSRKGPKCHDVYADDVLTSIRRLAPGLQTFWAEGGRGDWCDWSITRTNAQSCAEIDPPPLLRAYLVPNIAGCEFCPATVLPAYAQDKCSKRCRAAYTFFGRPTESTGACSQHPSPSSGHPCEDSPSQ